MDDKPRGNRATLMKSIDQLRMSSTVWEQIGYKYHDRKCNFNRSDALWQRKLFQIDGDEWSNAVGWMNWYVYRFPERTGYMANADIGVSDMRMGLRRMSWSPSELTVEVVRMVEEEYASMAGCFKLYRAENNK